MARKVSLWIAKILALYFWDLPHPPLVSEPLAHDRMSDMKLCLMHLSFVLEFNGDEYTS
jgi:hypothetical protein